MFMWSWAPASREGTGPDDIPPAVLDAYSRADALFAHYPSLKREALHPRFPGEARVRVPNRARTVFAHVLGVGPAFPYSVQRALATTLDAVSTPGEVVAHHQSQRHRRQGQFRLARRARWRKPTSLKMKAGGPVATFPAACTARWWWRPPRKGVIVWRTISRVSAAMPESMRLELKDGRVCLLAGGATRMD